MKLDKTSPLFTAFRNNVSLEESEIAEILTFFLSLNLNFHLFLKKNADKMNFMIGYLIKNNLFG